MANGKISGSPQTTQQPSLVENNKLQNDDSIAGKQSRSSNFADKPPAAESFQTSDSEISGFKTGKYESLLTRPETSPVNRADFGDFKFKYRARQLSKQLDDNQISPNTPSSRTQTKIQPDEIDVEYLVFVKANDLPLSAESLEKYQQIKLWLNGKTKPVSPLPQDKGLISAYNNHRRDYKLADSEELRQKFIQGYADVKSGKAARVFTDEEIRFLDDLRLIREQNLKQVPPAAVAASKENRASAKVDVQSLDTPRPQPRLTTGEPLKVSSNQTNVEKGFVRFESGGGETWLINPQTKEGRSESDQAVTDTIQVKLPSRSDLIALQPPAARALYIGQVAANLSEKYDGFASVDNPNAVKLPASDVKEFLKINGIVNWKTNQTVSDDFFYAANPVAPTVNHYVTKGDLKQLAAFSAVRRNNLENAYLDLLAGGRELTAEEKAFFNENEVSFKALESDRYADYQMALTKGDFVKKEWERFHAEALTQNNNDETVANLKAARRVGWISAEQMNKGLSEYQAFRDRVRDDIYQEIRSVYELPSPDSPSIRMPNEPRLQKSDVTEADINRRIEEIRKYSLSPAQIKQSRRVADFYNRELGTYGGAALGGLIFAGSKGWATIGGLFRIVGAESPAVTLGKLSAQMDLTAAQLGDDDETAPYLIKLTTGAVLDIPRIVLLSSTPLGAVGGFALASGLESYGKGAAPTTALKETVKGAALGALFQGAGNLGKSVINRTFFANAPKELVAGLSNADKKFLLEFASTAKNLPPAAYQRAIVSRVLGESTRIGTMFGGTIGIEKTSGATNDQAFSSAAQMVIFDLVLHHGGRGLTKITDKSLDPIRDKLFRVVVNGESRIVSVNNRNELVTFKKLENLPKEIQDKLIDGTFIAKDGSFKVVKNTPEAASVEPLTPAAVRGLGDIPLQQAVELSKILGTETVNASAAQLGGKRLQILADGLGVRSAKGIIEQKAGKGKFKNLIDFADNLGNARSVEFASPKPLKAASVVLDNNSLVGIEKMLTGTSWNALEPRYQNAVNVIRKQSGLPVLTANPPTVTLEAIIGRTDIRFANATIGETSFKFGIKGSGLKLTVDRNSKPYQDVLTKLESPPPVGQPKGFADRATIADTIFAETEAGVVPKFATNDVKVLERLLPFAKKGEVTPMPNESAINAILRQKPDGFEIEIEGHKLFVIPIKSF